MELTGETEQKYKADADICTEFLNSVSISITRTVGGSLVVLFSNAAGGDAPKIGAYYTGDEWIPCKWGSDGKYTDGHRKIDLVE